MSIQLLPENAHDLAWWLCSHLNDVRRLPAGGALVGKLPLGYDFDQVVQHIDRVDTASRLAGVNTPASRTIEFHPAAVGVYESIDDLLHVAANRKVIPARFTIAEPYFTYSEGQGGADEKPTSVAEYFSAVGLWGALSTLADIANGAELIFVERHDAQVAIVCAYDAQSLLSMPSLSEFSSEFCKTSIHVDQKRSIVRTALIEHFKPKGKVTLAEVMRAFGAISEEIRRSYAMYMNEFSFKKTRDEIHRQNLDDTLRLNKTLADIQNQLLALPAAILLAGATVKVGEVIRNDAVLAGVWVFCVFMLFLVSNQRSSVRAIAEEIRLRENALEKLPNDSKTVLASLFVELQDRIKHQNMTLWLITLVVVLVAVLSTIAVIWVNTGVTLTGIADAISGWRVHIGS